MKILFIYPDLRAIYLGEELKKKLPCMDFLQIRIKLSDPFFLKNFLICFFEMLIVKYKKDSYTKINFPTLYLNTVRRPNYVKKMSSAIAKYVKSMNPQPDLILQWQGIFKPYEEFPNVPYVLVIDNYADSPDSPNQKDSLRGWSTIYNKSFYQMQKELYDNSSSIFTLAKWCKEGVSREYGIAPRKVVAIGWGAAKKILISHDGIKKEKTILAVGSDYNGKGLDVLLKSAKYLDDFKITIVGKDTGFKDVRVPENVRITDHISDQALINLYSESELFFAFSEFEPAGHVLWEAQAHGCVIIGYDAFGIAEAVVHNVSGILLKTRDPKIVSQEIRALYRGKGSLSQMRTAAIRNYQENGTWGGVSDKLIMNLNQLLQRS